jgi:hypothetical protein
MAALLDLINALKQNKNIKVDDAFFTKRPLTGNSCASCEKNITYLTGVPAEYQSW